MKTLHVMPNDPLLQTLSGEQRDFILESIHQDYEDEKARLQGTKDDHFIDNSFDMDSDDFEIIPEGFSDEDMARINKQVSDNTEIEGYDEIVKGKIEQAKAIHGIDKARQATLAKATIEENYKIADELIESRKHTAEINKNTNYIDDDYDKL